ncbi:MAG: FeoA family protein [Elusimicrobiota bacterium]|nr:FeoA family protein [Elusimicrobiota bacterium]
MQDPMTLEKAAWDLPVRVTGFSGVGDSERARLAGMGLHVGETVVKLLAAPLGDPIECLVGQQLLALDKSLVARIRVEAA